MLISSLLDASADEHGDKPAAVFPDGSRASFAELERVSNQVARRLLALGLGPKKRVALLQDNTLAALTFFFGVQKAGAETVDIPTLASVGTIETILDEARPDALVLDRRQAERLSTAKPAAIPRVLLGREDVAPAIAAHGEGRRIVSLEEIRAEARAERILPEVQASDVAMIIYTSGTTGRPKGVMLSHDNLLSNVSAFNACIGLGASDSLLVVVPLYYVHGRIQLLTHTMIGGTLFFSAGFQFPKVVLDELVRHAPTGLSGVPYHFATLLAGTRIATTPLPRLKNLTITGGALAPAQLEALQKAVPGAKIHLNYGQTEASPRLTYLGPDALARRPTSCGRAIPGVQLEILGEDGTSLPPGVLGEVVATSPGIMKGYVSGDERSSGRIDAQGRLKTGDLGWLDEEGFLFLSGRSSEMIKSAGERIFPREIEEVLERFPGVAECAVLGLPDPILGEKLVALIVSKPGETFATSALRAHCLKELPFVRTPREVRFTRELPRTSSGKVRRGELRALFQSGSAAPLG